MTKYFQIVGFCLAFLWTSAFANTEDTTQTGHTAPVQKETILVAGATGQTGRLIVEQLRSAQYDIRAMTRSRARAADLFGEADFWVEADVTKPESLQAAMKDIDKVICTIGATAASGANGPEFVDYGGVRHLVDTAVDAGIKHFVLISSVGVTQEDHFLNKVFGDVLKWKLKGEDYLRQSGLRYTIVRPAGLQNMPGGVMDIVFRQGDEKGLEGLITRADVAAITIEALNNPDAHYKTFEALNTAERQNPNWADGFADLIADTPAQNN